MTGRRRGRAGTPRPPPRPPTASRTCPHARRAIRPSPLAHRLGSLEVTPIPARILVLDGDTTPLLITDRPTGDDYDPLPEGYAPERARVVRARAVRAGDLLIGEFTDDHGQPRHLLHFEEPVTAAPAPLTVPCWAACCWDEPERDVTRYVRLVPAADDDTPCEVYAINAPVLVIPAADRPQSEGAKS